LAITASIPNRCHIPSRTWVPPIGRACCILSAGLVTAVVAVSAVAGSSSRCSEAINRSIAAGST